MPLSTYAALHECRKTALRSKLKRDQIIPKGRALHTIGFHINDLWHSKDQKDWLYAEECYWDCVSPENMQVEKDMERLDAEIVRRMNAKEFYDFLHDTYFVWKYTAKNRLATTRALLKRHLNDLSQLENIHDELFMFDKTQIRTGLEVAKQIHGLGIAGASGLLAVLFPNYFGTVDQFLVKSLLSINDFKKHPQLMIMRPENLTIDDGVVLEQILRQKADDLNRTFNTACWTPRKVDKILWAYRSSKGASC